MTTTATVPRTAAAAAAVVRDADEVLGSARAARARAVAAEVQVLVDAVDWAVLNPPLFGREAATWYAATSQGSAPVALELTAEGVPDVDRAAVAELGIALGMSTQGAQRLLAEALELAFRLPTLWARVVAGEVTPWRARRVAQATRPLSKLAAAFVDREIGPVADRVTGAQLEGLVATAMARHDAELAEQVAAQRAEQRDVQIRLGETTLAGLTEVSGWVDLPDALDLDAALSHSAAQLAAWGSSEPLPVRRARALGELAREHLTFQGQPVTGADHHLDDDSSHDRDLDGDHGDHAGETRQVSRRGAGGARVRPKRQVMLYVHLTDAAIYDMISRGNSTAGDDATQGTPGGACGTNEDRWRVPVWVGRVENTAAAITAETIRSWCADPDTRLTVRPVLDLNGYQQADSYEIPGRIKEQIRLRDGTCIFPGCRAKALYCQDDHVEPYDHANPDAGGRTETTNLRLLCQHHHNLKTHHGFRYLILTNGAVLWRTPHGLRIRRNRDGTIDYLTRHRTRYRPDDGADGADSDGGDEADAHLPQGTAATRARRRGIPGWDTIAGLEALNPADTADPACPAESPNALDHHDPPPF
ncbi:HNH endonuclease signature motif containing protein [Pseudactinotalea terrae]|uniref:HNH endonuclease signature motif containing protein n=1 Tax=Pseudactinotalea terrae TaxID=1743262 RepID=UPI0012E2C53A|nr:HNH endonuclease signature motif containing protein [Pseudactinotalea terrae]